MDRPGFVLALCMVLMLGLSMLTGGMLLLATREHQIARTLLHVNAARFAAESNARRAFLAWSTREVADLTPGAARTIHAGPGGTVLARRLGRSLWMLESEARVASGTRAATSRAGLLVRSIDPADLEAPAGGVTVRGTAVLMGGELYGRDECTAAAVAGLAAASVAGAGTVVDGGVVVGHEIVDTEAAVPRPLTGLPLPDLATATPGGGVGRPRPTVRDAVCAGGEWNWGSLDPEHPCHRRIPLVHLAADATLTHGEGQGVLVADGDLTLGEDFTFAGILLVGGTLRVDGGAFRGQAVAGALEAIRGRMQYSSCAAARSLTGDALDGAFRPAGRWWVPLF